MTVRISSKDRKSNSQLKRFGFSQEGVLRDYYEDDVHAIVLGMTKREADWAMKYLGSNV